MRGHELRERAIRLCALLVERAAATDTRPARPGPASALFTSALRHASIRSARRVPRSATRIAAIANRLVVIAATGKNRGRAKHQDE
jgi:hypothetical protein